MVHAYLGERVLILTHHPRYTVEVDEEADVDLAEFYLRRPPPD
jgi:hypothetical protein